MGIQMSGTGNLGDKLKIIIILQFRKFAFNFKVIRSTEICKHFDIILEMSKLLMFPYTPGTPP